MFSFALQSLRNIVDDTIEQEDKEILNESQKKEHLTPLQSHIGILRNKPQPLFHTLPNELKLYIFSFIEAEELISSVIYVCREWKRFVEDERSWKLRFEKDFSGWSVFGTSTFLSPLFKQQQQLQSTLNNDINSQIDNNNNNLLLHGSGNDQISVSSHINEGDNGKEDEDLQLVRSSSSKENNNNNNSPKSPKKKQEIIISEENRHSIIFEIIREKNYFLPEGCSWKQWYMVQYAQNHRWSNNVHQALKKISSSSQNNNNSNAKSQKHSFNFISKLKQRDLRNLKVIDKQTIFRIPIFGWGLRNSARGLLYRLMWSKESPLTVNTLYPGVEGIGSGIGFRVNQKSLNVAAFYGNCKDLKDWSDFFQVADGIIYVVDGISTDSHFQKAIDQFQAIIPKTNAPILILVCFSALSSDKTVQSEIYPPEDPDEETLGRKRSFMEITFSFGLDKLTGFRHWSLRNASHLSDVCKGLEWLSSLL